MFSKITIYFFSTKSKFFVVILHNSFFFLLNLSLASKWKYCSLYISRRHFKYEFSIQKKSCAFPFGRISHDQVHAIIWNIPKTFCPVNHLFLSSLEENFHRNFMSSIMLCQSPCFLILHSSTLDKEKISTALLEQPWKIYKKSTSVLDQSLKWC